MVYLCTNAFTNPGPWPGQASQTKETTMKKVRVNWRNVGSSYTFVFNNNMMSCLETGCSVDKTEEEFDTIINTLSELKSVDIEILDEYEVMIVFQTTVRRFFPDNGEDRAMPMDPEKDIFLHYWRSEAFDKHYELYSEAKSAGGSAGEHESVRPEDAIHIVRHIDGTKTEIRTIAKVIKTQKDITL